MRRDGLWHPRLAALVPAMGHTDSMVIADAGLPVPRGVETVDLVWARREPRFLPVLRAVLAELVVESAVLAEEAHDPELLSGLSDALSGIPVLRVSHEELKARTARAVAVVRTGEDTPYANVILHGGVCFESTTHQTTPHQTYEKGRTP